MTSFTLASRASLHLLTAGLVAAVAGSASGQQFQQQTGTRFPSPNPSDYTNYVDTCDIDGDMDLDLIFANGGGFTSPAGFSDEFLRVFVNDGSGNFTDNTAAATNKVGRFRGVSHGDADGDGDQDLIGSQDFNRRPALMINDGNGIFTDESASRLPQMAMSSTRAQFGDIDNDGDLDIYINNGGTVNRFGCGQNRIWINDGTGHFTDETNTRHPLGNICQPMDVIFLDFDDDFDLDVRTASTGTNNSRLFENDGTGVFTNISGTVPNDSTCYSYDVGDINGDGNLDMIGANAGPSNTEMLFRGNGLGGWTNVSSQISPNPTADDNDSKFFDLDMDGDLDLIVAALFQTREKIYINDGLGNFTLNTSIISNSNDASLDVTVADFDGDGAPDIVTAQGESGNFQNRIYINVTGPADTTPPTVENMELLADTADTVGPYVVRVRLSDDLTADRGFFDKGVLLEYEVNGGTTQSVEMLWSGNSLWRGEIPGQAGCSSISYWVTATDWADNTGSGPTHTFSIGGAPPLGDTNGDCAVNVDDLVNVILDWDTDGSGNGGDVDGSGLVDVDDLVTVITNWTS